MHLYIQSFTFTSKSIWEELQTWNKPIIKYSKKKIHRVLRSVAQKKAAIDKQHDDDDVEEDGHYDDDDNDDDDEEGNMVRIQIALAILYTHSISFVIP